MKGFFGDFKTLFKELRDYKKKHNESFWTIKKSVNVVLDTLKKTWVLILLGVTILLSTALLAITNTMGERLYFSLIIIFIFVTYVLVNIVIVMFKFINKTYYDGGIRIERHVVKRMSKRASLFISLVLIVGIGLTQIWFVNHYINAPIAGYSYYDDYGNLLYEQQPLNFLPNGEKGEFIYTLENSEVTRTDRGELEQVILEFKYKNLYRKTITVSYDQQRITKIKEVDHCLSSNVENWYLYGIHSQSIYHFRYTTKETVIKYSYNSDLFEQTTIINFSVYGNKREQQLFYTMEENQVFKSIKEDSKTKIVLDQHNHIRTLHGNREFHIDLNNKGILTEDFTSYPQKQQDFSNDEAYNRAVTVLNNKSTSRGYFSIYFNKDHTRVIEYDYRDGKELFNDGEVTVIREKHLGRGTNDFKKDGTYEALKTTYKGEFKSTEKYQQMPGTEDDPLYRYLEKSYNDHYKHIYNGQNIKRIDQYSGDELENRYLFNETDYGYEVVHYSYFRDQTYHFTKPESNQFKPGYTYDGWTPMTLNRNSYHYTSELVYQELPYLYLLETE